MKKVEFFQSADFQAVSAAEKWCNEHGISFGFMQGNAPRGLKCGDCTIEKWRNLSTNDIENLDGQMTGNFRNGPVVIELKDHVILTPSEDPPRID